MCVCVSAQVTTHGEHDAVLGETRSPLTHELQQGLLNKCFNLEYQSNYGHNSQARLITVLTRDQRLLTPRAHLSRGCSNPRHTPSLSLYRRHVRERGWRSLKLQPGGQTLL